MSRGVSPVWNAVMPQGLEHTFTFTEWHFWITLLLIGAAVGAFIAASIPPFRRAGADLDLLLDLAVGILLNIVQQIFT